MELWNQVDWTHRLERPAVNVFNRTLGAKLGKADAMEGFATRLSRSPHWIAFEPSTTVYSAMHALVEHLQNTYGLEVFLDKGGLHKTAAERSWALPQDPALAARAMHALGDAEAMIEPRPFVRNGSSDTLAWLVLSSTDWATLEAADLYATRALFPRGSKVPPAPAKKTTEAVRRERTPEHAALLEWVGANKALMLPRLVEAVEQLETSLPGSTQERDATSQIYRIERRARRA